MLCYQNRNLILLPQISKQSAEHLKKEKEAPPVKKKTKINLDSLIASDLKKKKNFHLAKKGMFVCEENIETENNQESLKRANHLNEKLMKMQNPNMKISDSKVLLKNVGK